MSGNQQRGRGGGRGAPRGGRGDSPACGGRGDSQARGGRGDNQGYRGDGRGRGGGYRDGGSRGGGGPPGRGAPQQMAFRGPPPGSGQGGVYLAGQPVSVPDQNVTKEEDALVQVTRDRMFPLGVEGAEVPGRRGYGTKGAKITLRTNYFKITTAYEAKQTEIPWYRYDVDVQPQLSRDKKRRLFDLILTNAKFKDLTWATDYAKIIVTTTKLDLGNGDWAEKVVVPPAPGNSQGTQQGPTPAFVRDARNRNRVQFRVTSTGTFTLGHIIQHLKSTAPGAAYAGGADLIQMFNIIMCKPPNSAASVKDAGRNRFYPYEGHPGCERYDLGGGLQALRGYYASVRPTTGRLLLNLNVTSGAFYKPLQLNALIGEFGGRNNEQREAFIRMLKVKADYKKDGQQNPFMTKIKTIVGFAKETQKTRVKRFGNAREVKFQYTDSSIPNAQPQQISVFDYFRRNHGITLQMPDRPVLNVGTRADPQYMPIELCTVLPGQPYNRLLGGDQTSEMLKFAARFPNLNADSIAGSAQAPGNGVRLFRLRDAPNALDPQVNSVQPWGVGVGTDMLTVPGRVLSCPQVKYLAKSENPRNGSWNLVNQKFARPGKFDRWQALVINRRGPRGNALQDRDDMMGPDALFNELGNHLRSYGINMGQGRGPTQNLLLDALTPENRATNDCALEQIFQKAAENRVNIMLVVLPEVDRWLYARIKTLGDVKYGIHTINAVGSKMQKTNGQGMYLGNLALKFNIKGGGTNHTVQNMFIKPLDNNTMLVGIDVTHPSPGSSEGAPSISCVVASVDEHLTQWPGSVRTQEGRKEMVSGLKEMVLERLALWRKRHNNNLPTKIILYRDGVSEGQYDQVLLKEVPAFNEAFAELYGAQNKWPKLTVIIVGKRHHTRFYPTKIEDADCNPQRQKGSYNPKPGTIVDRHISGRIIREFWLQAHQGLQGTARPAHYVVIKDDINFEADELETFTHNMCYLFNRATKAVSICPPAYYADLLCERGRAYLFSVLAENHGTDSSEYSASSSEWTGGVHANLAESTWYI